jgi:hypothetical protein
MPRPKIEDDDELDDDFNDPEEDLEAEEQEQIKPQKTVVKTVRREEVQQVKQIPQQKVTKSTDVSVEYSPFAVEARVGVMNKATREPIGEDIYTVLAVVLNKLQKIEEAVC